MFVQEGAEPKPVEKESENPIKRPPSAFILYCQDKREKALQENPKIKPQELIKLLGKQWKEIGDSDKKQYRDRAAELLKSFKETIPDYHYASKSEKNAKKRYGKKIVKLDNLQMINHLFSSNPFMLQQMLLNKETSGKPNVMNLFYTGEDE